jgi:hypothetical protein
VEKKNKIVNNNFNLKLIFKTKINYKHDIMVEEGSWILEAVELGKRKSGLDYEHLEEDDFWARAGRENLSPEFKTSLAEIVAQNYAEAEKGFQLVFDFYTEIENAYFDENEVMVREIELDDIRNRLKVFIEINCPDFEETYGGVEDCATTCYEFYRN